MTGKPMIIEPITDFYSYFKSLDWSEGWLYGVILFYLMLYVFIFVTRRFSTVQTFTFFIILLVVFMATDLNEYLAKHHKMFTQHQYFDSNGMFISIGMSCPLLLAAAFIVVNWVRLSLELMKQVALKRARSLREEPEEKKSL